MRPERSPYDEKLDSILSAAAEIFAEKGFHNASIREISRATGISLSGLYYYFQSKEELLFLIQDHAFGTLLGQLEAKLAGEVEPDRRIRILIDNHLRYFVANMAQMKVLSHEADSLSGAYQQRVNAQKRRLTELVAGILGELHPGSGMDARVATFGLFGMMNWIYNWYRPERDVPVERLADEITRLFLYGFLPGGEGGEMPSEGEAGRKGGRGGAEVARRDRA